MLVGSTIGAGGCIGDGLSSIVYVVLDMYLKDRVLESCVVTSIKDI